MHYASLTQTVLVGLLVSAPLAAGYGQEAAPEALSERHVGGLAAFAAKMVRDAVPDLTARHHTEAQIAAKKAKAEKEKKKGGKATRDVPAPDEFGPWDSDEDEFGSWVDKRDLDAREPEPHHTEAQIAAKKAKAEKDKKKGARDVPAPDEFGPWDSDEDEFGSWVDKRDEVEAREPHHTEAQIAAKKAKAEKDKKKGKGARDEVEVEAREAHHTEAQIAAKKAKAEKDKKKGARDVPAPDEFGPWDSDEDEFGSWVDKRDEVEAREPHHTEAQIAAKKAKAEKDKKKGKGARDEVEVEAREAHHTEAQIAAKKAKAEKDKKKGARDVPAPDEFGPWDSDEDEFGSWVDKRDEVEAREPHHTEAQIAAKKAKAEKDKKKGKSARDEVEAEVEAREAHHTEAQIAAKKAKAEKDKKKGKGARDEVEVEAREPHHTEAQIAAKKAKAEKDKKKAGH